MAAQAVPYIITSFSNPQNWGDPNKMFDLSQSLIAQTETYVTALEAAAGQLVAPVINPNFPTVATAPTPAVVQAPNLIDVTWTVPDEPGPFTGVLEIGNLLPGPFAGTPHTLVFPTAPTAFSGSSPDTPTVDLSFTYPDVEVTLPTPPSLLTLDTVNFPDLDIPSFNATVPQLVAVAPSPFSYSEGQFYTSSLLGALQASLTDALTNGTWTGLPPLAEEGLWNRAREREYRQQADAIAELDRMETMGFAFPPGVYIDARIKIQTETAWTIAGLSRDIMVKQAELILENTVKARENATQIESKLIDYYNQVLERSFNAAKFATESSISIYNSTVEAYKASLDGYRVEALVYETQIKGILAQVDVLKAQIAFEQVKSEINTALVSQYKTEVEAAMAIVDIYKLQVEIIQTRANVEKIKVDIFGAQIQAFVGQINAYTAQVEGYKAGISAQGMLETVYKTQVDAYSAEVNAGVAEVNAIIAAFRGQIEAYTAQLEGYKAAITGMVGQAQAASLYNTAEADVYRSATAAITSYNGTLTAQWQAVMNEQVQIAQIGIAAAKSNGDLYIAERGLSLDASKVGAQVVAQLGAASLGAIHWANNSSWASSENISIQNSAQNSSSTNENDNSTV
jgi:hypothetical protein